MLIRVFAVLVLLGIGAGAQGAKYEPLALKELEAFKGRHCTLFLPWASWCSICVEELPVLLPALNVRKTIHPVVLDLSSPFVQEKFSRTFLSQLDLYYTTYRIPMNGEQSQYPRALDPTWKGALPTAFLYTCVGKKCGLKQRWDRALTPKDLDEIVNTCNAK